MFRYIILGLLRNGEPLHGYALTKQYLEYSGLPASTGNFYRELQRMVGEGLLRPAARLDDVEPRRMPYEITEAGATTFDTWLLDGAPDAGPGHVDDLSSRALFLAYVGEEAGAKALNAWRRELWSHSKRLERSRQAALGKARRRGEGRFAALPHLLGRRLKHLAADLEFIDELDAALRQWAKGSESASDPAHRSTNGKRSPRSRVVPASSGHARR